MIRSLTLDPVTVEFVDCAAKVQTAATFREGSGDADEIEIDEYMVACYGTTEYPENMTPVRLYANSGEQNHELSYAYKCRDCFVESPDSVKAVVPPIKTQVTLTAQGRERTDYRTHSVAVAFTGSAGTGAANGLWFG